MKARIASKIVRAPLDRFNRYTKAQIIKAFEVFTRNRKEPQYAEIFSVALVLQERR